MAAASPKGCIKRLKPKAGEFADIYELEVLEIPTNRPIQRIDEEDEIYRTEQEKFAAITKEIKLCQDKGQPVLGRAPRAERASP